MQSNNFFPVLIWLEEQKQFRIIDNAPEMVSGEFIKIIKTNACPQDKLVAEVAFRLGQETK